MPDILFISAVIVLLVLSAALHLWQSREIYDLQARLAVARDQKARLHLEVEDLERALTTRSQRLDELECEALALRDELETRRRPVFDQTLIASNSRYLSDLFAARDQS